MFSIGLVQYIDETQSCVVMECQDTDHIKEGLYMKRDSVTRTFSRNLVSFSFFLSDTWLKAWRMIHVKIRAENWSKICVAYSAERRSAVEASKA